MMKGVRYGWMALVAVALVAFAAPAYAFHSGGVAECVGCHSMHEANSAPLLVGGDASSTCLNCHTASAGAGTQSFRVATNDADLGPGAPPKQRTPGGDFGWLKKEYTFTPRPGASAETNYGRTHGHNIVAADYGYVPDSAHLTAPGGTMDSTLLGCQSCHDPHGQARRIWDGTQSKIVSPLAGTSPLAPIIGAGSYHNSFDPATQAANAYAVGVYRLLGGPGYTAWDAVNYPGAPPAVVNSSYNRTEFSGGAESHTRVAYGYKVGDGYTSWSQWCGTCHTNYHTPGSGGGLLHPTEDQIGTDERNNYNSYKKTGDLTGVQASSFTSLVPFAKNLVEHADLKAFAVNGSSGGPLAGDRMACLTCHRAHASAWDYALRWNHEWEFLTLIDGATLEIKYPATDATGNRLDNGSAISGAGSGHRGYNTAEMLAAYYDRPATVFAGYQRVLCNKCHIKD